MLVHVCVAVFLYLGSCVGAFLYLIYLFVYSALIYYILTTVSPSYSPPRVSFFLHCGCISWCVFPYPCLELRPPGPPRFFALLRRKPHSGFPWLGTLGEGPAGWRFGAYAWRPLSLPHPYCLSVLLIIPAPFSPSFPSDLSTLLKRLGLGLPCRSLLKPHSHGLTPEPHRLLGH